MAFAKKMMGFPVRIWSHFRTKPNCRQRDMRKYKVSHFLQGQLSTYIKYETTRARTRDFDGRTEYQINEQVTLEG